MKKTRTKMPDWLIREIKDNPALADLKHRRGRLPVNNIMAEALIISASYAENPRPILVVKKNLYHAQRFYERISSFLKEDQCALFGSDESLRVEAIAASPEMRAAKGCNIWNERLCSFVSIRELSECSYHLCPAALVVYDSIARALIHLDRTHKGL